MGIKGTVRRSTDGDFIHANVDIGWCVCLYILTLVVGLQRLIIYYSVGLMNSAHQCYPTLFRVLIHIINSHWSVSAENANRFIGNRPISIP